MDVSAALKMQHAHKASAAPRGSEAPHRPQRGGTVSAVELIITHTYQSRSPNNLSPSFSPRSPATPRAPPSMR
jgi:hypothetical protein